MGVASSFEFNGNLQGVAFYDRKLTSDEIDKIYVESRIEEVYEFPYLYMIEQTLWEGMLEWATADLGIFYFDEYGNFIYEYRNTLHDEALPRHSIAQYSFSDDVDIISGSRLAEVQSNRVVVTVNPITTINSDEQGIWRAEQGESLVVTKTREVIDDTRTDFLKVQTTGDPLWLKEGYFKIDDEIIGYTSKSGAKLIGLTRGMFGTTAADHGTKTYSFENSVQGFRSPYNCQISRSGSQFHDGSHSIRVLCEANSETGDPDAAIVTGPIEKRAVPSVFESTTFTVWVYSLDTARQVRLGHQFYDRDGDAVGFPDYGSQSLSTLGGWKQYTHTFTPSGNEKYWSPIIYINNPSDGERHFIDELTIDPVRPKVREVRFYDIEYDQAPAIKVKTPFITAEIFEKRALTESFKADAFTAEVLVSATERAGVGDTVLLEGVDPTTDLEYAFAIAGIPLVEESDTDEVEEEASELESAIRRHKVKELTIENRFIQNKVYAKVIADHLIEHFKNPVPVMNMSTTGVPHLQLGDRIEISAFDQLDINGIEFWILETSIQYDGGLQQSFTLREVS